MLGTGTCKAGHKSDIRPAKLERPIACQGDEYSSDPKTIGRGQKITEKWRDSETGRTPVNQITLFHCRQDNGDKKGFPIRREAHIFFRLIIKIYNAVSCFSTIIINIAFDSFKKVEFKLY